MLFTAITATNASTGATVAWRLLVINIVVRPWMGQRPWRKMPLWMHENGCTSTCGSGREPAQLKSEEWVASLDKLAGRAGNTLFRTLKRRGILIWVQLGLVPDDRDGLSAW